MRTLRLSGMATALALVLTACYWPQNYTLNIEVGQDGTVKVKYDGQMVNLTPKMVRLDAQQEGKPLTAADQQELVKMNRDTLKEFQKTPGFSQVKDLGNDTFALRFNEVHHLKNGESYKPLMDLLVIQRTGKKVTIRAQTLDAEEKAQVAELKLTTRGAINITTGGKVLSTNASKAGILGRTYRWQMDRVGATAPVMEIALP